MDGGPGPLLLAALRGRRAAREATRDQQDEEHNHPSNHSASGAGPETEKSDPLVDLSKVLLAKSDYIPDVKEEHVETNFRSAIPLRVLPRPALGNSSTLVRGYIARFNWKTHYVNRFDRSSIVDGQALTIGPDETELLASIPVLFHRILSILQDVEKANRGRDVLQGLDKKILRPVSELLSSNRVNNTAAAATVTIAKMREPTDAAPTLGVSPSLMFIDRALTAKLYSKAWMGPSTSACRKEHVKLVYENSEGHGLLERISLCPGLIDIYYITPGRSRQCVGGLRARNNGSMTCACGGGDDSGTTTSNSTTEDQRPSTPGEVYYFCGGGKESSRYQREKEEFWQNVDRAARVVRHQVDKALHIQAASKIARINQLRAKIRKAKDRVLASNNRWKLERDKSSRLRMKIKFIEKKLYALTHRICPSPEALTLAM
eukprot:jgi/Bigna1/79971/fgenesh1_pg.66_\